MIDQRTAPYGVLLLRLALGYLAIAHLYYKFYVLPNGLDGWWTNLNNNGYPDWVVMYVLSAEFAGALLLLPGIFARYVALYSVPLMLAAAQYWYARKGFFFTLGGMELPGLWTIGLLTLGLVGDGAYALVPSPKLPFFGGRRMAPAE
ncbi:MAG: DoxX family membrane protein [Alphaproteobacteria bacterium]|nr:DoxX family membrane protein [Alphaproteobacteria bacterium]